MTGDEHVGYSELRRRQRLKRWLTCEQCSISTDDVLRRPMGGDSLTAILDVSVLCFKCWRVLFRSPTDL